MNNPSKEALADECANKIAKVIEKFADYSPVLYAHVIETDLDQHAASRVAELREALAFYAEDKNYSEDYEVNYPFRATKVTHDRGEIARKALAQPHTADKQNGAE